VTNDDYEGASFAVVSGRGRAKLSSREDYWNGFNDAIRYLLDPETYHGWIVDHPDRDILSLLPSQRRAAAIYLSDQVPKP